MINAYDPIRKRDVIEFLEQYPEDYEVRVQAEDGKELAIVALEWANGPWIVVESDD